MCADPPSRAALANMLANVMIAYPNLEQNLSISLQRTAHLVVKKPPSVHWQIMVLSTLDPDHAIFAKNYVKPTESKTKMLANKPLISNADNFFTDLPVVHRKTKGKFGIGMQLTTKAERE